MRGLFADRRRDLLEGARGRIVHARSINFTVYMRYARSIRRERTIREKYGIYKCDGLCINHGFTAFTRHRKTSAIRRSRSIGNF